MKRVAPNLWIGNDEDCKNARKSGLPIIHVCRTCFKQHHGVSKGKEMVIDIVDMPEHDNVYLFRAITLAVDFIQQAKADVLIHCNQGKNRSPFFAMAYLMHTGNYADAWKIWKSGNA